MPHFGFEVSSCRLLHFSFLENISDRKTDILLRMFKQIRQLVLTKPNRLFLKHYLDLSLSITAAVYFNLILHEQFFSSNHQSLLHQTHNIFKVPGITYPDLIITTAPMSYVGNIPG